VVLTAKWLGSLEQELVERAGEQHTLSEICAEGDPDKPIFALAAEQLNAAAHLVKRHRTAKTSVDAVVDEILSLRGAASAYVSNTLSHLLAEEFDGLAMSTAEAWTTIMPESKWPTSATQVLKSLRDHGSPHSLRIQAAVISLRELPLYRVALLGVFAKHHHYGPWASSLLSRLSRQRLRPQVSGF